MITKLSESFDLCQTEGLEEPFATLGRDKLKGTAGMAPGGKVGSEVANKDEHAYIDVLFLSN